MGKDTGIQWTHHTFNPWRGCTKVADECAHCYAEQLSGRNPKTLGKWGPHGNRVVAAEAYWQGPTRWNKAAEQAGERRRVFCASLADVFEDWDGPMLTHDEGRLFINPDGVWMVTDAKKPPFGSCFATMNDVRRRLFALIDSTPWLDWLLLTKRPENILRMWQPRYDLNCDQCGGDGCDSEVWMPNRHPMQMDPDPCRACMRRSNAWLGTSAGTQESADRFIPELLQCRDLAPVLFVSCEPMLDQVDFDSTFCRHHGRFEETIVMQEESPCFRGQANTLDMIDWLIIGCESNGPRVGRLGSFTNEASWWQHCEYLANQAEQYGVSCFVKQGPSGGKVVHDPAQMPIRVPREFPQASFLTSRH